MSLHNGDLGSERWQNRCMKNFMKLSAAVTLFFAPSLSLAIVNGKPSSDRFSNSIGALTQVAGSMDSPSCTATLIAPDWIVTAQHCRWGGSEEEPVLLKPQELRFSIGRNKNTQVIRLKEWVDAPSLEGKAELALDVAFARLESRPRGVAPASIAVYDSNLSKNLRVYGFGSNDLNGSKGIGVLRVAPLTITADEGNAFLKLFGDSNLFLKYLEEDLPGEVSAADRHLEKANLISGYTVHAWTQRGGGGPSSYSDTCYGDSGGPLVSEVSGKAFLVGIVSQGFPGEEYSCAPLGTVFGIFGPSLQKVMDANGIRYLLNQ